MLTSTVVYLSPVEDCTLAPTVGRHAHALFLSIINHVNPHLAQVLHDPQRQKPFTVSPLQGPFTPITGTGSPRIGLSARQTYWMRFTTLSPEVFQPLVDFFLQPSTDLQLCLQSARFHVRRFVTDPSPETRWAGRTDWHSIALSSQPARALHVRFFSPTTFRQASGNVAEPRPDLVISSWWDKWNAFAPTPVHLPRDERVEILTAVRVAECDTETRMLDFGRFKQVGFVGTVRYDLSCLSYNHRRWLNLLGLFAFYGGTGAKTTMGMGQTLCR
ncbi:MAG: CRISPR-associated endoribonuclease Cas6 [Armatimonadota bacterium]